MHNSNYKTLRYSIEKDTAKIILDRPPLNLIDRAMTLEYHEALREADLDPRVRVIVLAGRGKGLSGGLDLKYIENFNANEMKEFLQLFYVQTMEIVRGLSKPIIAAVHGFAREGACTLAFACDMIIAADDADFGYPGVPNLAAPPGMHVWILQKLIGRMKATELILTGKTISSSEAERMGLITRIVPAEKLMHEIDQLAQKLAEMSPLAITQTRDLIYQMESMPFEKIPKKAAEAFSKAFGSNDSREARKAYIEKRKPNWTGT